MKVAVVIPTLNEGDYIGPCLQSLRDHAADWISQVIVVDAGSSDGTVEIAANAGATVLIQARNTIASQRNHGAAHTNAELLAFLDADCTIEPGWAENAISHFDDPEIVSAGAPPDIPDLQTSWVQRTWCFIVRHPQSTVQDVAWMASANVWVRRTSFREIGGFDESLETCEDSDLGFRICELGRIVSDPSIRVRHHREPRTLLALFWKEIWHGKNSYDGLLSGRFTWSELPSLLTPIICGVAAVLFLAGVAGVARGDLWGSGVAALGALGMLVSPVVYTLRVHFSKGKWLRLPLVFVVYVIYFSARTTAALRAFFLSLQSLFQSRAST